MDAEKRQNSDEIVGANIRALRELKEMSQAELARRMTVLGWPWHQSTVYRIEQGRQPIGLLEAKTLAVILETSADRFTWVPAEANETEFVYAAGTQLKRSREAIAEAVSQFLLHRDTADRVVDQYADSEYERVREARRDVAARLERYSLDEAVEEGVRRHWERDDGGEEDQAAEEVPTTTEHRHNVGSGEARHEPGSPSRDDPVAAVANLARGIPLTSMPPDQLRATLDAFNVAASPAIAQAMSAWTSADAQRAIGAIASAARNLLAKSGMQPGTREAEELTVIAAALGAASAQESRQAAAEATVPDGSH